MSLTVGAAWGEDAPVQLRFDMRHAVLGYVLAQQAQESGPYNPGNLLARLPSAVATAEWREDMSLRYGNCDATLAVRASVKNALRPALGDGADEKKDLYARAGGVRCSVNNNVEVRLARSVVTWGNATYRSPSNPMFDDTGKTDPVRELVGKDLAEITLRMDNGLNLSALHFFAASSRDPNSGGFKPTSMLRVDYTGVNTSAGMNISHSQGRPTRVGGYVTYTVDDALILYNDVAWQRGSEGLYPVADASSPMGWRFAKTHATEKTDKPSALVGAAYTFVNGWTLTGEFLYDKSGYSDDERRQAALAAQSGEQGLRAPRSPAEAQAAAGLLASALSPGLKVVGRRYVFLQLLRSELRNRGELAVRWAHDIDNAGSVLSTSLTWSINPAVQLLVIGNTTFGTPVDGRVLKSSLLLGLRTSF